MLLMQRFMRLVCVCGGQYQSLVDFQPGVKLDSISLPRRLQAKTKVQTDVLDELLYADDIGKIDHISTSVCTLVLACNLLGSEMESSLTPG